MSQGNNLLAKHRYLISQAAQAAWWIIAVATVGLNLYGLVTLPHAMSQICATSNCYDFQLTTKDIESIHTSGLSIPVVIAILVAQIGLSVLIWNGMGLLLYRLKRSNPFFLWISIALITFGSSAFGPMNFVEQTGPLVVSITARVLGFIGQLGFLFFYVFPDGRFYPRWMRWLALAWVLLMLPQLVLPNYTPVTVSPALFLVFLAGAFVIPLWRYHSTTNPIQRQQIKWVVFSMLVAVGYFLAFLAIGGLTGLLSSSNWFSLIANALLYLVMAFIPVAVGIAMLRYRLWDIDILIRRTLQYGALTALLVLLYLATVVLLQQVLRSLTGQESPVAVVITTLAIAALFNPLQRRFQIAIDRRFYRKKYDAQQTLDRFSLATRSEVDLNSLSDHLLAVTDETLQPEHMSLWLARGSDLTK